MPFWYRNETAADSLGEKTGFQTTVWNYCNTALLRVLFRMVKNFYANYLSPRPPLRQAPRAPPKIQIMHLCNRRQHFNGLGDLPILELPLSFGHCNIPHNE